MLLISCRFCQTVSISQKVEFGQTKEHKMNKVIKDLRNEIKWTLEIVDAQHILLTQVKELIALGETDVIAPSEVLRRIARLEGEVKGFERAIDLLELHKIELSKIEAVVNA